MFGRVIDDFGPIVFVRDYAKVFHFLNARSASMVQRVPVLPV